MGKRKRNKFCWCGSGKKYKDCHFKREAETPISISDLLTNNRKIWTKEYCLHPQQNSCSGNIIRAHTIQRRGSLERISNNGHVYTFKTDLAEILKTGKPEINLVGIKKASTFTGFCSHHDNELFKPIEEENFFINEETGFLLSYRVLCHELFLKRAWKESLLYAKENLDKGKSLAQQFIIQDIADSTLLGVDSALNDLTTIKSSYDEALIAKDYKKVKYYAIILEDMPKFVCSGFTQPIYDFHGNQLQDLADLSIISEHLAFSVIATNTGGAIIYSWMDRNNSSTRLIKSLINLTYQEQLNASVRFAFEYFENLYISPGWWNNLDVSLQQNLFRRHLSGTPDYPHTSKIIMDDGLELVTWKVSKIETNFSEE